MKIKVKVHRREVSREWMKKWILNNTYFNNTGIEWIFEEIPETMEVLDFIRFMIDLCDYTDFVIDERLQVAFPGKHFYFNHNHVADYIEHIMMAQYIRNYFNGY